MTSYNPPPDPVGIVYSYGAHADEFVRVCAPAGEGPFPYVVHVPGGGFYNAAPGPYAEDCAAYNSRGLALVWVSYRGKWRDPDTNELVCEGYCYPDQVTSVRTAIQWLIDNGSGIGLDVGRYCIHGGSAGGFLAAWSAVMANPVCLSVQSGPVDLTLGKMEEKDSVRNMLNGYDAHDASPLFALHSDMPPTFLIYSTGDPIVPIEQGEALRDELTFLGIPVVWRQHSEGHVEPNQLRDERLDWTVARLAEAGVPPPPPIPDPDPEPEPDPEPVLCSPPCNCVCP